MTNESPVMRVPFRTEHVSPGFDLNVYVVAFESREGPLNAWVFVSRGLSTLHHRELVFAVKARAGETQADEPVDVAGFFRGVFEAAKQGHTVDVGGRTIFESKSGTFLGRKDVGGVIYTWVPPALADTNSLLAILLTKQEMTIASEFGHTRVLARLGESTRFYPTPPWMDRDRAEALRAEEMSSSLLGKVAKLALSRTGVFMTQRDTTRKVVGTTPDMPDFEGTLSEGPLTLLLDRADVPRLKAALEEVPPDGVLALLTSVPPSIGRCLVWNPVAHPARSVTMINDFKSRDDPRCAGNFLLFYGGEATSRVRATEDGFALLLTDADLSRVRQALAAGKALNVNDDRGSLLLEIRPPHEEGP